MLAEMYATQYAKWRDCKSVRDSLEKVENVVNPPQKPVMRSVLMFCDRILLR